MEAEAVDGQLEEAQVNEKWTAVASLVKVLEITPPPPNKNLWYFAVGSNTWLINSTVCLYTKMFHPSHYIPSNFFIATLTV